MNDDCISSRVQNIAVGYLHVQSKYIIYLQMCFPALYFLTSVASISLYIGNSIYKFNCKMKRRSFVHNAVSDRNKFNKSLQTTSVIATDRNRS